MFLMLKKLKFSGIIITLSFVQLNSIKGIGEVNHFVHNLILFNRVLSKLNILEIQNNFWDIAGQSRRQQ